MRWEISKGNCRFKIGNFKILMPGRKDAKDICGEVVAHKRKLV